MQRNAKIGRLLARKIAYWYNCPKNFRHTTFSRKSLWYSKSLRTFAVDLPFTETITGIVQISTFFKE